MMPWYFMLCYRRYPINAEACGKITRRDWNPTTEVVKGGLSCVDRKGGHTEGSSD